MWKFIINQGSQDSNETLRCLKQAFSINKYLPEVTLMVGKYWELVVVLLLQQIYVILT